MRRRVWPSLRLTGQELQPGAGAGQRHGGQQPLEVPGGLRTPETWPDRKQLLPGLFGLMAEVGSAQNVNGLFRTTTQETRRETSRYDHLATVESARVCDPDSSWKPLKHICHVKRIFVRGCTYFPGSACTLFAKLLLGWFLWGGGSFRFTIQRVILKGVTMRVVGDGHNSQAGHLALLFIRGSRQQGIDLRAAKHPSGYRASRSEQNSGRGAMWGLKHRREVCFTDRA